ncbi:AcrR family transcriptional regulator [Neorhizobium sp. 2083]|nr:AcrR family transcriptional regulator [Neorhizobium sp. 2083]
MKEAISDQILTTAGALFYREGIRAVGIGRIIEEANVAKATLYRHFPSKDHLVAAYLQARHERVI